MAVAIGQGFEFDCDVEQGFNFDASNPQIVGFIEKLKIGDVEIPQELQPPHPDKDGEKTPSVGIVEYFNWSGEAQSEIEIIAVVSLPAKQEIAGLYKGKMEKDTVEISFKIIDFDGVAQQYYCPIHTDGAEINAVICQESTAGGSQYAIGVGTKADKRVQNPENYVFHIKIEPPEKQDIHIATSVDKKQVKEWGMPK